MKIKKSAKTQNSNIINVGLVGLGTVGTGVARILISKASSLISRSGFEFRLKTVCVKHASKKRRVSLGKTRLTTDPRVILNDPEIDQVVELIGGTTDAYKILHAALSNGKDVISANKALFAEKGEELFRLANRVSRHIGLEASVCGGIPIVKALSEGLAANRVTGLVGILNGTCNYILTEMSQKNRTYAEALQEAQARGFAEANPALDVNGTDTAHKLALLARLAFQRRVDFKKIRVEGISGVSPEDIFYAKEMGYSVKLIAIARRQNEALELSVHPALLDKSHQLANVNGVYNAVLVRGDETDDVLFYGKGAGERPTASAVVSDMIDLAKLRRVGVEPHARDFAAAKILPPSESFSRYYLRFQVEDKSGTLGRLTVMLGRHGISISSVHQIEAPGAAAVPVIMLTHGANEKKLFDAVRAIDRQSIVKRKTVVLRVEGA